MPKNTYSDEFKADSVNLYQRHPELSYTKVAEDLGIGSATLKVWVRQARKKTGTVPTQAPGLGSAEAPETAEEELARLRVEVEALRADKRPNHMDDDRVPPHSIGGSAPSLALSWDSAKRV